MPSTTTKTRFLQLERALRVSENRPARAQTDVMLRHGANPVITPDQVAPSQSASRVRGAFNPGASVVGDEVVLLLRVTEDAPTRVGRAAAPQSAADAGPISHLRVARSRDGVDFQVDTRPFLVPELDYESHGVGEARITPMGDRFLVTYAARSRDGIATGLLETFDFVSFDRLGLIFHPNCQDVSIFPGRRGGLFRALHRPDNAMGKASVWYAESPDALHWGNHHCVLRPRDSQWWEDDSIGGGGPSILTDEGWLQIYSAFSADMVQSLWAVLLDRHDPARVIARGAEPLLVPSVGYETVGTIRRPVSANGIVEFDGALLIYYSSADEAVCLATSTTEAVLDSLR